MIVCLLICDMKVGVIATMDNAVAELGDIISGRDGGEGFVIHKMVEDPVSCAFIRLYTIDCFALIFSEHHICVSLAEGAVRPDI